MVLAIWVPVGFLLIALVVIAFVGGAFFGNTAILLVPATMVAVSVRGELVSRHPMKPQTFVFALVGMAIFLSGLAFSGARGWPFVRRRFGHRQPT
jgi:hypothetical protein